MSYIYETLNVEMSIGCIETDKYLTLQYVDGRKKDLGISSQTEMQAKFQKLQRKSNHWIFVEVLTELLTHILKYVINDKMTRLCFQF
jgi:hypothetical protein